MSRIPTIKKIIQNPNFTPGYVRKKKEEYDMYLKKYKIISDKGLDIDEYLDTKNKAECVAGALGDKIYSSYNGEIVGFIYSYSQLSIKLLDDVKILFNGAEVLTDTKYYPGEWEEIVLMLYDNIRPMLKEKIQKKETIKNVNFLASKIEGENGELNINSHLVVKKFYNHDRKDEYISYGVNVINYNEIVFSNIEHGFEYEYGLNKTINYKPGMWEDEIKQYIEDLEKNNYNDFLNDNIDLIRENIKELKKKYN